MDHGIRRERLAATFADLGVDGMLVTHLPNVRYLSGYSGSNGQVIVAGPGARFFTDGRYIEQSRREVPDLERVIYSSDFIDRLTEACADLGIARLGFESESVTYRQWEKFQPLADTLVPLQDEVGALRWIKDDEELGLIAEAQRITDAGFAAVLERFREGMTEKELARALEWEMLERGATGLAFETIAAFGEQSAEPHHEPTDRPLAPGDMVKLDFGALFEGYHSDMTRTVAFGEPSDQMREVYEVVRAAQQAGVDAVREGIAGRDADAAARKVIEDAGYGDAFTHSLGHGVGLEIHEGPTLTSSASAGGDILPSNTVVTVEPGVYLAGIGGVRIEDMVIVESDGCRVMPSTTKELIVL